MASNADRSRYVYLHAAVFELSICESDETGSNVSLVVGQLLYATLVVAAAAARAADASATRETGTVAVSGLCHCTNTSHSNQVSTMTMSTD